MDENNIVDLIIKEALDVEKKFAFEKRGVMTQKQSEIKNNVDKLLIQYIRNTNDS